MSDEMFTKLRITRAYIKLLCIPVSEHGIRMVSLANVGNCEVRIFDAPKNDFGPLFWMELFDHDAGSSVDGLACYSIEDALTTFEDFLSR
jgi:hypothetical protein